MKTSNPVSDFFIKEMPMASNTDLGIQLATHAISIIKRDHKNVSDVILLGYLNAWNERGGRPFDFNELQALLATKPAEKSPKKNQV